MAIQKKSLTGKSLAATVPPTPATKGKTSVAAPKAGKLETTSKLKLQTTSKLKTTKFVSAL